MAGKLTKHNFEQEVVNSDVPVMVDFWAPWCGPCRMMLPVIDEIHAEADGYKVMKVNIDEEPELASQYNVMTIPTIAVMEKGMMKAQSIGVQSKQTLLDLLDK